VTSRSQTSRSATRASICRTAGTTFENIMIKPLLARLQQGHRTGRFPDEEPTLPDRFRGRPALDPTRCPQGCDACAEACPTGAIVAARGSLALDMGRCLFCTDCTRACPEGAIEFTQDYRLAARER